MARASSGSAAREKRKIGLKNITMLPENCFWKEDGCRRNSSTLVGQMKVNVKLVTRRKAQKSTGFTIARMVRGQTGDPRGLQAVGAKRENLKEGVEVAKRYCNASTQ